MKTILHILCLFIALLLPFQSIEADNRTTQYAALLDSLQNAYDMTVGSRSTEIPLTADELSSNASDYQEGQHIEYLLDGDASTFWHSDWHNRVTDTHYIQIDLAEPVSGDLGLYVLRRVTSGNHATMMGLWVSKDSENWSCVGEFSLGNAASGLEATSNALSLGTEQYSHLRLTIDQTTSGSRYSHFAEIRLLQMEVFGPSYVMEMSSMMDEAKSMLTKCQEILAGGDVSTYNVIELQSFYNSYMEEFERIKNGEAPSYMTRLTDLPSVYINTYDGSAITSKTVWTYAKMWRITDDGTEIYDSLQIRGRGNSTWGLAKKPYRVKFANKEKFLGKGHANARNWTLMANHVDNTLIHNATASFIAEQFGQTFVPGAQFVDLTLNGEYIGNYQISDHVDVHKKRVEVYEQEEPATDTTNITGGYLLELEGQAGSDPVHFTSGIRNKLISIKSPDEDVINDAQKTYIIDYVNDFEKKLYSTDYQDSLLGYRPIIDSLSLASMFLTVEATANPDGYYSIYFYKDKDDPIIHWGPIWDYDIAFNNCYRKGDLTQSMMINSGYSGSDWPTRFYSDPWFKNLVGRMWHRAVADGLVYKTLAFVDSMAQVVDQSQQLNFQKWSITERTWDERVLYSTYAEGIEAMKTFITEHAQYLSDYLENPENLRPAPDPAADPLEVDPDYAYYIYNVGNSHPVDIDETTGGVCTWEPDETRKKSQLWKLVPVTGDYYRIVSVDSKLAITDMAVLSGGDYNRGSQLMLQEVDENNDRQLWCFVPTANDFAVENKLTVLAWNNSNAGTENGCHVISWTNNSDNAVKTTRQWRVEKGDKLEDVDDAIDMVEQEVEYKVVYSPSLQQVNIRIPLTATNREGTIQLYNLQGQQLASGTVGQPISLAGQPDGIYLLKWTVQGHSRSVKFRK